MKKLLLLSAFVSCALVAFSQTAPGLIYRQATSARGRAVMDPNGDGFISATTAGFSGTDFGAQSELPMIALPIISNEPMSDLTTGSNGGQTDIVSLNNTTNSSVFILKRNIASGPHAGDYLVVRFRLGKNGTSGKGYSILIDSDLTFGSQYGANNANPGFEKEIVLQTGSQAKVVVYSYGGPTGAEIVAQRREQANGNDFHQRAIALSTNGGDADVFYDFFVPFSDIGLTNEPVRLVATTVTNSVSAISGTKSDFNGVNDKLYGNNPVTIQNVLINNFPPTPLNALVPGGGFNLMTTTAPTINGGISAGTTSISGTSQELSGTTIQVFLTGSPNTLIGTATVDANGNWTATVSAASTSGAAGGTIFATATAPNKTVSAPSATVTLGPVIRCYLPPPTITNHSNGTTSILLTWSWPNGSTPSSNQALVKVYRLTANTTPPSEWLNSSVQQWYGTTNNVEMSYNLGAQGNTTGAFVATITLAGCESQMSNVYLNGNAQTVASTAAPTINTTSIVASSSNQNITVLNNHSSAARIIVYINGAFAVQTAAGAVSAGQTTVLSLPPVNTGDLITARAIGSVSPEMLSNASTGVTVIAQTSVAPVITGSYNQSNTSVSGTSNEAPGTVITLFNQSNSSIGTTTVQSGGTWIITDVNLASVTSITARATAIGKLQSANSSPATNVATVPNAPVVTGPYTAGATSVSGTAAGQDGHTITLYLDGAPAYHNDALLTTTVSSGTWTISAIPPSLLVRGSVITATATNAGVESRQSAGVTVTGVNSFAVRATNGSPIGTQTAGQAFGISVTAKDGNLNGDGNDVTGFTGRAVVSSINGGMAGVLTSNFVDGVIGNNPPNPVFNATLTTAGPTRVLWAVSEDDPTVVGSATFTVNPGAVARVVLTSPPDQATGNRVPYTVTRQDAFGNLVTTGSDLTVNLTSLNVNGTFFNQSSGGSQITSVTITNGNSGAQFWLSPGPTATTAGTYQITASSTGLTSGQDTVIVYGVATNYNVTVPSTARIGSTVTVTAQLRDANNNPISTAGVTVNWSTNNGSVSPASSVTNASGIATTTLTVSGSNNVNHVVTAGSTSPTISNNSNTLVSTNAFVWNGSSNVLSTFGANWQAGLTPGAGDNVVISASATNFPALIANTTFGSLTLEAGSRIDLNGSALTIDGPVSGTGTIRGSSTSSLTLTGSSSGALYFDQTGLTDRSNNLLNSLTLNTSGNVTLENQLLVNGAINLSGSGSFDTKGNLVIASDPSGTGYITGDLSKLAGQDVTAERFISSNIINGNTQLNRAWRMLAPIVTTSTSIRANWQEGVNNPDLTTNLNPNPGYGTHITGSTTGQNGFDATQTGQASMFTYNQATQNWTTVTNTNTNTLFPATGYLIFIRGDRSMNLQAAEAAQGAANTRLRARGPLVTSDLTFSGLSTVDGHFSLITNPFASSIDWHTLYDDGNQDNFESSYTVWDPNVGSRGGYVTYSRATGFASGGLATRNIQSGMAFFVQRKVGATGNSIIVKTSHRSTTNNIDLFRSGTQQELFRARLFFNHTDNTRRMADAALVVHNNTFSAAVDGNDALQIANWDEDIAFRRNNKLLSIEARPLADAGDTMFLNIARLREMTYEWEFVPENFNAPGLTAFLQDAFTNTETAISLNDVTVISFSVTADPASKATDRFRIVYRSNTPLPVTLTNARAYQVRDDVKIEWRTEHESGIKKYVVEKSLNGTQFNAMGEVEARSQQRNDYTVVDNQPNQGDNFYRIAIVSNNNSVKYSSIMKVRISGSGKVQLYPNPMKGRNLNVTMDGLSAGKYEVIVYNAAGARVMQQTLQHPGGSANYALSLQNLSAGVYSVRIISNMKSITEKLIIE